MAGSWRHTARCPSRMAARLQAGAGHAGRRRVAAAGSSEAGQPGAGHPPMCQEAPTRTGPCPTSSLPHMSSDVKLKADVQPGKALSAGWGKPMGRQRSQIGLPSRPGAAARSAQRSAAQPLQSSRTAQQSRPQGLTGQHKRNVSLPRLREQLQNGQHGGRHAAGGQEVQELLAPAGGQRDRRDGAPARLGGAREPGSSRSAAEAGACMD